MLKNLPLGLPLGSVRAILAIALVAAVIALAFQGKPDKDLVLMAGIVLAFYFAGRVPAAGASSAGD